MNSNVSLFNSRDSFLGITLVQAILLLAIAFDVPVVRQVFGFIFLTFIPGFVLLKLLKFDGLEQTEKFLFSVGLSIAFVMLSGLLLNELAPLVGVLKPLSLVPIVLVVNLVVFFLSLFVYLRDKALNIQIERIRLHFFDFLLIIPPVLAVAGAYLVNLFPTFNQLLLLMIVSVCVLVVYAVLSDRHNSKYPLIVLSIAVALLLHVSLISNYINGQTDIYLEFFLFRYTKDNSFWTSAVPFANMAYAKTNSMLSVTILPTIYSIVLNIGDEFVLKLIFPLIFSLVPLGLYQIFKKQLGDKVAFLSAFFFMANYGFFYELVGVTKQMIGELFFVLLFILILNKKLVTVKQRLVFIIFSFGLVVSHYSMAYMFVFLIAATMVILFFLKQHINKSLVMLVLLFFTIQFAWYIYVSNSAPFVNINEFINDASRSIFNLFSNPGSQDRIVQQTFTSAPASVEHLVGRAFAYLTQLLIVVGFIGTSLLFIKRQKMKVDNLFFILAALNIILLGLCLVLPYFAQGLNIIRFYHIQLFFLAPFCVIGAEVIFKFLAPKSKTIVKTAHVILLVILIIFFLFQTDFIYEVTDDESWSIALSKYRMDISQRGSLGILDYVDIAGAEWLSNHVNYLQLPVYCDNTAYFSVLGGGYGMMYRDVLHRLDEDGILLANSVIYLRKINTDSQTLWMGQKAVNITDTFIMDNVNLVYSNGGCLIYKNIPSNVTVLRVTD